MTNWNDRWIELAFYFAKWSKDTSRKVGAVIVSDDKRLLSIGYNGMPSGVNYDQVARSKRPEKYFWYEHAERNAIYNAGRYGVSLIGSNMYCTLFPCAGCTRAIIQAGIKTLYAPKPNFKDEKYGQEWRASVQMLNEAGVAYTQF